MTNQDRRGEVVLAVRWRLGRGRVIWASKAEACRSLGITPKKLEKCLQQDDPVVIRGERWYLDMLFDGRSDE